MRLRSLPLQVLLVLGSIYAAAQLQRLLAQHLQQEDLEPEIIWTPEPEMDGAWFEADFE